MCLDTVESVLDDQDQESWIPAWKKLSPGAKDRSLRGPNHGKDFLAGEIITDEQLSYICPGILPRIILANDEKYYPVGIHAYLRRPPKGGHHDDSVVYYQVAVRQIRAKGFQFQYERCSMEPVVVAGELFVFSL